MIKVQYRKQRKHNRVDGRTSGMLTNRLLQPSVYYGRNSQDAFLPVSFGDLYSSVSIGQIVIC